MDVWPLVWLFTPQAHAQVLWAFSLWLLFFWGLEIGTACYESVMIITAQMRFAENLWFSSSLSSNFLPRRNGELELLFIVTIWMWVSALLLSDQIGFSLIPPVLSRGPDNSLRFSLWYCPENYMYCSLQGFQNVFFFYLKKHSDILFLLRDLISPFTGAGQTPWWHCHPFWSLSSMTWEIFRMWVHCIQVYSMDGKALCSVWFQIEASIILRTSNSLFFGI